MKLRFVVASVCLFVAAMLPLPCAAATGQITDARSGKPLSGATVYAVWRSHLWLSGRMGCGGITVTTTDANGDYDVGTRMALHAWFNETVYWVVAPGHRSGGTYTSKDWSPKLEPLDGLPLDTQLQAIAPTERYESCVSGSVRPYEGMNAFDLAIRDARLAALCDPANGGTTPQTDVFQRYFNINAQAPLLWRVFVLPLMPLQTSHPIPVVARDNACALATTSTDAGAASTKLAGPLTLRITFKNIDSLPPQKIPVRLLWGARANSGHTASADYRNASPKHGAIAYTDADGNADFPITEAMLLEQDWQPGQYGRRRKIPFAAIPYASDRIALDPMVKDFERLCAKVEINKMLPHIDSLNGGVILDRQACRGFAVGNSEDESYKQLDAVVQRETQWRATGDRDDTDASTLRMYAWQWPSTARLTRTYDLLALPADTESNPEELNRLQRAELAQSFDAICHQPATAPVSNPRTLLRSLWWAQAQTDGTDAANRDAQTRAMKWDTGPRCGAVVSTRPPVPLTNGDVCSDWEAVRARLDNAPVAAALPFEQMQIDFSQRAGACPNMTDFGSSL